MAEKQDIREDQMTIANNVDYLRGLNGNDSVLITPSNLPYPNTGGGYVTSKATNGKWYRIAIGTNGSGPSTGLFNIANYFGNDSAKGIILYAFTDGYSGGSTLTKIASTPVLPISKARVVFAASTSLVSYLDIYVRLYGTNTIIISASSLIGFNLKSPEEVTEAIPEGYSVKEASF